MMGNWEVIFTTANLIHAVKETKVNCHIVKLGTMGVYGTPNIDIEEAYLEVEYRTASTNFFTPRSGSHYHLINAQKGDMH